MQTGRGFERLVNFTDAVVAIALTLLVLPLVEIPAEFRDGEGIAAIWDRYDQQFWTFLLSFAVIWKLWQAHHALLEYFRGYDRLVVALHMVWLFTIVVLPFTTELVSSQIALSGSVPVYLINLLVSTAALLGLELRGRANPTLLHAENPEVRRMLAEQVRPTTQIIIALAVAVSFVRPVFGLWTLLLLTVDNLIDRRLIRRRPATVD